MTDAAPLGDGAALFRGFVAAVDRPALLRTVDAVAAIAPFRHWDTPNGRRMSVAMTGCGARGWVSDRHGYRYDRRDPSRDAPWPAMPPAFAALADRAAREAGYDGFVPDCCLLNRYAPRSALSLHRDADERDRDAPIVSVSLGLPATFLWGGLARADPVRRFPLADGDVVVWGGPSRFRYHGIAPIRTATPLDALPHRINLTFRRTGIPD